MVGVDTVQSGRNTSDTVHTFGLGLRTISSNLPVAPFSVQQEVLIRNLDAVVI